MLDVDTLLNDLREGLGARIVRDRLETGQLTIEVRAADITGTCLVLRDHESLAFKQLSDLCGVDYLCYGRADWETRGHDPHRFQPRRQPGRVYRYPGS